jgi:methylmalonyl-CoA mutase cobalamin-binding subunit
MERHYKILLAPLDPVHDVGIRIIAKGLVHKGYDALCLPPDVSVEEVVEQVNVIGPKALLIGRTIGYGLAEVVARLVDMLDATGQRRDIKLGLGGKTITQELAAELGFDRGFGPGTTVDQVVDFIEGRNGIQDTGLQVGWPDKKDITLNYSYRYNHEEIGELLDRIADDALQRFGMFSSPGLERAIIREKIIKVENEEGKQHNNRLHPTIEKLREEYASRCNEEMANFYLNGIPPRNVKELQQEEVDRIVSFSCESSHPTPRLQTNHLQPLIFIQYGTGCPLVDIAHIKGCEAWGADGILHFDPVWEARSEGLLEGYFSTNDSGTLYTPQNIKLIRKCLNPSTVWCLRAHRGLNTPETVVLAGNLGADMVKINPFYGGLSGGTDPERMLVDAIGAIKLAAKYDLVFDIPVGHELSGVPTDKTFASIFIVAAIAKKISVKTIFTPLFCYSPHVIIEGKMENNYVDYNGARIKALKQVMDAPIRAGEPVGFMTHTEERVQSAVSTALHTALAMSLGVDAVVIASTDEAYSGGPISLASRIDTLKAVKETFRFFGATEILPTDQKDIWANEMIEGIFDVLKAVEKKRNIVDAMYEGLLGCKEEGVFLGRSGKGTVFKK